MRKIFYLLILLSITIISCEKEPFLSLSSDSITVPASGNSTIVTVIANNPWTVSGADWCTVSPSSGDAGEVSVIVSVKENTTYDVRNCNLTFSSAGLSQIVSVKQDVNLGVVLQKSTYEISSDAQQITVEVKANVAYDISIDSEWIKQVETKALTSTTYTFSIEANETYDAREGSITIKEKNSETTEIIKVKQPQKDAIIISAKEYNLTSDAQTLDVKLQTNVDLEVIIPDSSRDWISYVETKSLASKILKFDIKSNDDYNDRNCSVIVKKKNSDYSEKVKITQAQKDAIIISTKEFELSSASHTLEVKLQTNMEMEVIVPDAAKNWITFISTKALADKTLLFSVKANETYNERIAEIYVKSKSISVQDTIRIKQTQNDVVIIPTKEYNITSEAQTLEIKLQTNIDFEVVIPDTAKNWISYIETKTLIDKTILLNISANETIEYRNCILSVKDKQNTQEFSIKIKQSSKVSIVTYTTIDGKILDINPTLFDAKLLSNTYNDKGVLCFEGDLNTIGNKAFDNNQTLSSIDLPESVKSIGQRAFQYCKNLVSINLKEGLKSIERATFIGCELLQSITIPNSTTHIGDALFVNCFALENVSLPNQITDIPETCFGSCVNLKKLTIPEGVTTIASNAFSGCYNLNDITFPLGVLSIGDYAFSSCNSLEEITIPLSVNNIGSFAFAGCTKLQKFNGKYASSDGRCLVINNILHSFAQSGLVSYNVPDIVTTIGSGAFSSCIELQNIILPTNIESIEDSAFELCRNLKNITLPLNVKRIGKNAFNGCINLTNITLPDKLSTIGAFAFRYCGLSTINIPESVNYIGEGAFTSCLNLKAFYGKYTSLDNRCLIINNTLNSFAPKNLSNYIIPDGIKNIGWYAFSDSNIIDITLSNSIETIEDRAFEGCQRLKQINISENVIKIGLYAFSACFSLQKIYSKSATPPILQGNLFNFTNGITLIVPKGSKTTYENSRWKDYFSTIIEMD